MNQSTPKAAHGGREKPELACADHFFDETAMLADHGDLQQVKQRLEQRDREIEAARLISQALFQRQYVDDLVEQALHTALEVVHAQAGSVLLANAETRQLVFYHSVGEKPIPRGQSFSWDAGIAGAVFRSGEAIVSGDVKNDPRHYPDFDEDTGLTTHDMIALPLKRWEGCPIGVLSVINKRDGRLGQDDVDILTIISAFTATAIEEARLFEEAKLGAMVRLVGDLGQKIRALLLPIECGGALLQTQMNNLFSSLHNIDVEKARAGNIFCREVIEALLKNSCLIQEQVTEITNCVKGYRTPLKFAPCWISEVLTGVIETLRFLAEEKGIKLRSEGVSNLPLIRADERRLFNAFYNLIHTVIEEMHEGAMTVGGDIDSGGSITVRGDMDSGGSGLNLEVVCTGPRSMVDTVGSLTLSHAENQRERGLGLPKKIASEVVNAHGGRIAVKDEGGLEKIFQIYLPFDPPTSPSR